MKKSRFTESQLVAVSRKRKANVPVAELTRKHGISGATYFNWRSKYAGVSVNELKRAKEFGAENAKLKRLCAELALENAAIKDVPEQQRGSEHRQDRAAAGGRPERALDPHR
jgi:putative transposase